MRPSPSSHLCIPVVWLPVKRVSWPQLRNQVVNAPWTEKALMPSPDFSFRTMPQCPGAHLRYPVLGPRATAVCRGRASGHSDRWQLNRSDICPSSLSLTVPPTIYFLFPITQSSSTCPFPIFVPLDTGYTGTTENASSLAPPQSLDILRTKQTRIRPGPELRTGLLAIVPGSRQRRPPPLRLLHKRLDQLPCSGCAWDARASTRPEQSPPHPPQLPRSPAHQGRPQ